MLMIFLVPMMYFTFTSSKNLVLFVLAIGGIPLTTFMPDLVLLGFLGGLSPQAAFLFFIVAALGFVLMFSNGVLFQEMLRFNVYSLFIIYTAFSVFWGDDFIYGLRLFVKLLSPFLLYLAVISFIKNNEDLKKIENALYFCVLVVLVLIAINYLTGGAIGGDKVKYKWIPLGVLTAPYMSPANFSFFVSSIALYSVARFLFTKENKYFVIFVILSFAVFAAFTRIAMAGLVVGTGICVFMLIRNKMIKVMFPLVLIFGFVLMLFTVDKFRDRMFYNADEFSFSQAIESPEMLEKNFDTSGRIFLWANVLERYKDSSVLFGGGVGSLDLLMDKEFKSLELHSEYLRLFLDLGLVGLVLYLLGMLQMLYRLFRMKSETYYCLYSSVAIAGIAYYLITLFTDNSLNYVTEFANYIFLFIGLAVVATRIKNNEKHKEEGSVNEGVKLTQDKYKSVELRLP